MKQEMICIGCPMGCYLTVDYDKTNVLDVSGNRCNVGVEYATKEIVNPERILTTSVKVRNGNLPLVSVRTDKPIPKSRIFEAMNLLANVEVEAPIKIHETIIPNIFAGINVVATKNISRKTR